MCLRDDDLEGMEPNYYRGPDVLYTCLAVLPAQIAGQKTTEPVDTEM
jgi:hypothetical protein